MHFPHSISDQSIISKFPQLLQIYTYNIQVCHQCTVQRESFILSNNDSFVLCGFGGFHIMTWFVIRETIFHLEARQSHMFE